MLGIGRGFCVSLSFTLMFDSTRGLEREWVANDWKQGFFNGGEGFTVCEFGVDAFRNLG